MDITLERYKEIGTALQHGGMSDNQIDAYFAHHGVKGMKWGQRRSRNRQLNRESRARDKIEIAKEREKNQRKIDKARGYVASGQGKRDLASARAQYKQDKLDKGSREARKILAANRQKVYSKIEKSREIRDGKELVATLLFGSLGNALAKKSNANAA